MKKIGIGENYEYDYNTKEAYNSFRTNLRFCGDDIKIVMITSCTPEEGKSLSAMSLARACAEDGMRILFIDADLRRSRLVNTFKIKANTPLKGLSHYLSGQESLGGIIYTTGVKDFEIVLAGPSSPNPTELLGNKKFRTLLEHARENYDMVIIDTPPLGSVIDAAVIAPQCDGAVLLIESEVISRRFAVEIKEQLEFAGCRILGAALNKVRVNKKHYNGYYRRYYSGYYGSSSNLYDELAHEEK